MRMIPAKFVQEHLQNIVELTDEDQSMNVLRAAINAGEDLGLLTVDDRDEEGNPEQITWLYNDL